MAKSIRYCDVCGIDSTTKNVYNYKGGGCLCDKHWGQFKRFGKFFDNNPRCVFDPNEIRLLDTYAEIDTYDQYGNVVTTFKVDLDDVEKLKNHKWRTVFKGEKPYLFTGNQKSERIYFHRLIFPSNVGCEIDHISGDSSDNRKSNLRIASMQENKLNMQKKCDNTSGIRGVSKASGTGMWKCDFTFKHMRIYTKPVKTIEEAVYIRYLLEKEFLKELRNEANDKEYLLHINKLSDQQKKLIEEYVINKINTAKAGV